MAKGLFWAGFGFLSLNAQACSGSESLVEGGALADQAPWILEKAEQQAIVEGLETCLADLGVARTGAQPIVDSEWAVKKIPPLTNYVPDGTIIYGKPGSSVLLVRRPPIANRQVCAVVVAADTKLPEKAIDSLGASYAAGRTETPHGWMWHVDNLIISNDYPTGYRFEPAVIPTEAFFAGEYHDIEIYKCEGTC